MDLNGVINKVCPKTVVGINGAQYINQNGLGARDYDKWRMGWNGNLLAPPDPGAVLYLPGYPGFGSTIFDYSYNFNDSGIDTDEDLTATETGIDCDADATTAIPVGSIIIIESEWCKVTATGTTLTVLRGYHGTTATSHDTNQDIRTWVPNNGTITGATWVKMPSGPWVLSYPGTAAKVATTCTVAVPYTIHVWAKLTQLASVKGGVQPLFDGGTDVNALFTFVSTDDKLYFNDGTQIGGESVANQTGWNLYSINNKGVGSVCWVDGVQLFTGNTSGTTLTNLTLGWRGNDSVYFKGMQGLVIALSGSQTLGQVQTFYSATKHLHQS